MLRKRLRPGDVEAFFPALPPPSYVKACVKRGRTDAAAAEAICEAVTRPRMHAVPVETADQQAALTLHRARPPGAVAHGAGGRDAPAHGGV